MATADPNLLFARAQQAFVSGRLAEAQSLLEKLAKVAGPQAPVIHLRALTAKRMGDKAGARRWFEDALRLDPNDAEIHSNYGNLLADLGEYDSAVLAYAKALKARPAFLNAHLNRAAALQKLGRLEEALADVDTSLAIDPDSARAHAMRGNLLLLLDRLDEAARAYDATLKRDPRRATALVGRATIALRRGEADVVELFERAAAARPGDLSVILSLAEAMEAMGDPRALPTIEAAVRAQPGWIEGQATLARMRWEAGEGATFVRSLRQALADSPRNEALWAALARVLGAADLHREAADAAAQGQTALGGHSGLALIEALRSSETGDLDRAEKAFARVPPGVEGRRTIEARHRLRTGEIERAQGLLSDELAEQPWDITAWALQGVLWRLTGDPASDWLHAQPGLVSQRTLDLDPQQIEEIADLLRSLHRTRAHPIGQSLRGGTQTRGSLFDRIEPEIVQIRDSIRRAVDHHWDNLPPRDDRHPLLRWRDQRPQIRKSWSVRLAGGGFHVAHIHPEGIVSSASYLALPGSTPQGEGWLEVGGPPPELGLDLEPLQAFEPKPGSLVLFPSTMFHGTRRFGSGERLTVAFDVQAA